MFFLCIRAPSEYEIITYLSKGKFLKFLEESQVHPYIEVIHLLGKFSIKKPKDQS
jgi:hypothetical protein